MKRYRVAHLPILIFAFALTSPKAMAQLVPAAEIPTADATTIRPPSRVERPGPIVIYTRPTEREKLRLYEFDAVGPYAFWGAALAGGFQQAKNSPPEWNGGMGAFGERTASNFGIQFVTTTTRYGLAEILREDTGYYRCLCEGLFPRLGHALISTVAGRHGEDGHMMFSVPGLVSPYAGTMTALAWYPGRYGVKDGFRMGNYNLLGQAVGNLAREFIYGGPHTLFRSVGRSRSPDQIAEARNP
jgi:hypothetical protein